MTRDDIIRMAREAGLWPAVTDVFPKELERFAALVAARTLEGSYDEMIALVRAAEREACAKVCEELELKSADGEWGTYVAGWSDGTDDCAAAIRARGDKPCK